MFPCSVATLRLHRQQHHPHLSTAAAARPRRQTGAPGSGLRRRETTMTPDGRQRPPRGMAGEGPHSSPQVSKRKGPQHQDDLRVTRRRSLAFTTAEPVRTTAKPAGATVLARTSRARAGAAGAGNSDNPGASSSTSTVTGGAGLTVSARNRLEQFRCVRSQRSIIIGLVWHWQQQQGVRVRVSVRRVTSFLARRQVDACMPMRICRYRLRGRYRCGTGWCLPSLHCRDDAGAQAARA